MKIKYATMLYIAAALLIAGGCAMPAEQTDIVVIEIEKNQAEPSGAETMPTAVPASIAPEQSFEEDNTEETKEAPMPTPFAESTPKVEEEQSIAAPEKEETEEKEEPQEDIEEKEVKEVKEEKKTLSFGESILEYVNEYRANAGMSRLKYASSMQKAADIRAAECAESFSHTRPNGERSYTAVSEQGITFTAFGENIYAAMGKKPTAKSVVESWMGSSSHKANILSDKFEYMCIGVAVKDDETYVAQLFMAD